MLHFNAKIAMIIHSEPNFFSNSGKLSLVPYTKDFGRITHFWGNDLATVQSAAFYLELLTRNSYFVAKIRILLIYKKHCTIYYVP